MVAGEQIEKIYGLANVSLRNITDWAKGDADARSDSGTQTAH
jgi:hypothetical protein